MDSLVHVAALVDEFWRDYGWTIIDPGPGQQRTVVRGDMVLPFPPRCLCDDCPAPGQSLPARRRLAA